MSDISPYRWSRKNGNSKLYSAFFALVCTLIGARHGDRWYIND